MAIVIPDSWNCTNGVCSDPGTGNGAYASLAACQAACVTPSWNCNNGVCSDPGTGNGAYASLAACQIICGVPPDCVGNEINWLDPLRPTWTTTNCGLSTIIIDEYLVDGIDFSSIFSAQVIHAPTGPTFVQDAINILNPIITPGTWYQIAGIGEAGLLPDACLAILAWEGIVQQLSGLTVGTVYTLTIEVTQASSLEILQYNNTTLISTFPITASGLTTFTFTASSPNDTFVFTANNGACCTICVDSISITGPAIEKTICDDSECILLIATNQNGVPIPNYNIYLNGEKMGKTNELGILKFQIPNASVERDHIINFCLCLRTVGNCSQQKIHLILNEECPQVICDTEPNTVSCKIDIEGCTDIEALNYNPLANIDDGSCYCCPELDIEFVIVDSTVTDDVCNNDGSITLIISPSGNYTYNWQKNGIQFATTQNLTGLCGGNYNLSITTFPDVRCKTIDLWFNVNQPPNIIYGCTNPLASNYDATATIDDGSCINVGCPECPTSLSSEIEGCCDPTATNYDPDATCNDGSCIPYSYGCMDSTASNYNSTVNTSDNSCVWLGCTDPTASNYGWGPGNANTWTSAQYNQSDNGSCTYTNSCQLTGSPNDLVHIPDANFRSALEISTSTFPNGSITSSSWKDIYGNADISGQYILHTDIASITQVTVNNQSIADLTGIECFTALTHLNCWNNNLTSLDVSANLALTYLSCHNNQLTSLNVSGATALTHLYCGFNQLTSLNVSTNTALTYFNCRTNNLTSFDVSGATTALLTLECQENQLTTLDVSQNTALTTLDCYNNNLTSINVSTNTALTFLRCHNNQLTSLNVSGATALAQLHLYNNQLTSLNVSQNTALTALSCTSNQLTSLDVSLNTALTSLTCDNNQLTSLNVSGASALTYLNCDNNQLTSLNVSLNTALTSLTCDGNPSMVTLNIANGSIPNCGSPNTPTFFNATGMNTNIEITINGGATNAGNYAGCTDTTATFLP